MKHLAHSTFLFAAGILLFFGCKKDIKRTSTPPSMFAQEARQFFIDSIQSLPSIPDNYRASQLRTLHWEQATKIALSLGTGILVPVTYTNPLLVRTNFGGNHFYNLDNLCHVLLYQVPGKGWKAEFVTSLPDSGFLVAQSGQFTGIKIVEDWQGNPIEKYRIDKGVIRKYKATNKRAATFHVDEVCYEIAGYNYPSDDPADGYYWVEDAGCDLFYYSDDPGGGLTGGDYDFPPGGGGGAAVNTNDNTVTILPGKNIIKNVSDYFKCFTNVGGNDHTYTVTVCVHQPVPGTRAPWAIHSSGSKDLTQDGGIIDVGHTFLVLTEVYGNTTITRNIGFYPATNVIPGASSAQGELNNDDDYIYNIAGSFTIDNGQFFNILIYLSQGNQPGYQYDLNTNNCSTFVLHALAQGNIYLPNTIGTWPGGYGNNPGDLGEDLRTGKIAGMSLITNMTASHFNVGQCQ